MKNYIFSYGSLISKESLAHTIGKDNAGKAKTATLKGYERGWRNHVHHEKRTGLGIIEKQDAEVNGIIFEIDEQHLDELDKREYGFDRRKLNSDLVEGNLWAWFVVDPQVPTDEYPIALTYVDTVLAGCLTHGVEFAKEFLRSTANWEYPFINDRDKPRFPRRAEISDSKILVINRLLKEILPAQYHRMQIE